MYQLGVRDDILRCELCKVKEPTLAEFDSILEAHALMEASEKQRNKSAHTNRTSAPQKKSSQKTRMSDEEKRRRAKFKGKCFRCGAEDHMVPQCKLSPTITCNSCKQSGHIAAVCERTATDNPPDLSQLQLQYSPGPPAASSCYVPQQGYQDFNQPTPELPL